MIMITILIMIMIIMIVIVIVRAGRAAWPRRAARALPGVLLKRNT